MERAVINGHPDTGDWEFQFGTFGHAIGKAFFTGRDILGGNPAPGYLVDKFKVFVTGFQKSGHTTVLTRATGLFLWV